MKGKKFTPEQIIRKLREGEATHVWCSAGL